MKNIILQHWIGDIDELTALSVANIRAYADLIGSDHRLVTGTVLEGHTSPCQKLCMLSADYDEYDNVVMMDADMFTRTGLTKNIFEQSGIGRHYGIQDKLVVNLCRRFPLYGNVNHPYWGGSIYKLERDIRIRFRNYMSSSSDMTIAFSGNYEDEGIMHALAVMDNMPIDDKCYLEKDKWNKSSFETDVEDSYIVHIRPKKVQGGPKFPKIENYNDLREKGIV